VKPKV